MGVIRCQVAFPTAESNVGADVIQNTWHAFVVGATTPEDAAAAFHDDLEAAYRFWDDLLTANAIDGTGTFKAYDLTDPEPRSPIFEDAFTVFPGAGAALPLQCAVCLSLRSVYVSGQPKARAKGRVYLGGFEQGLLTSEARIDPSARGIFVAAAEQLRLASDASTEYTWQIWSPTDAAGKTVTGGWVDDVVDIQRRRQQDLISRDEFGAGH